jgi:DNA helicase-2/ATP-dependent DNA helicase PcrA
VASISEQVAELLSSKQSFVVDAGAGSGKTRTLVEALVYLLSTNAASFLHRGQRIVCITYTNRAANEITGRINADPLVRVSTIHDFLWSVISSFQSELKAVIYSINSDAGPKKIDDLDLSDLQIEYWQYPRNYSLGKLWHDDVIEISALLFERYPKLARLVADQFPVIFVDEYQDTDPRTIALLLDSLLGVSTGRMTIGLFGDYMQKIYNTGVGRVDKPFLRLLQKTENYRCPVAVIDVLNALRPELQQVPGTDNEQGEARFVYSTADDADVFAKVRESLTAAGWVDGDTKILMLTRRGIADNLDWQNLLEVYQGRHGFSVDDLMARNDEFGELFATIESLADSYRIGQYGGLLVIRAASGRKFESHRQKQQVADEMAELNRLRKTSSIGEVVDFVIEKGLVRKPKRLQTLEDKIAAEPDPERSAKEKERTEKDARFLETLRAVPYAEVVQFEEYLNDLTPFSTSHGVKGEEYENVLVVLDDRLWNQYKFESVLAGETSKKQYERSLNLFYVACSRARKKLLVLALSPMGPGAIDGAKRIFGEASVSSVPEFTEIGLSARRPD